MKLPPSRRTASLLLALAAALCLGWGRDGHKIASAIAEHHLAPEAKAAVNQLLGGQLLAEGIARFGNKPGTGTCYWSGVYHHPDCSVVKRIKPENFVEYMAAPEGKRLHKGCPQ